jgi:hypothetical protein
MTRLHTKILTTISIILGADIKFFKPPYKNHIIQFDTSKII